MKYLLLFCGKPHEMEAWEALPDEALQLATTWPFRPPAPSVVEIRPQVEQE